MVFLSEMLLELLRSTIQVLRGLGCEGAGGLFISNRDIALEEPTGQVSRRHIVRKLQIM